MYKVSKILIDSNEYNRPLPAALERTFVRFRCPECSASTYRSLSALIEAHTGFCDTKDCGQELKEPMPGVFHDYQLD